MGKTVELELVSCSTIRFVQDLSTYFLLNQMVDEEEVLPSSVKKAIEESEKKKQLKSKGSSRFVFIYINMLHIWLVVGW